MTELVKALRDLLPPKIDYADLVCAESFAHGQRYVWDDPEPYIIEQAADAIEQLLSEVERLEDEVDKWMKLQAKTETESRRFEAERDAIKQSCDGLCISHDNVYARLNAALARAEKAEAERDAAVRDVVTVSAGASLCTVCKKRIRCWTHARQCDSFEWRGTENGEDNGM